MSHIVIVEDNENNARLAEKLLSRAGHQVYIAPDGEDGLFYVTENHPDLILLDLGLPDIDGQTVASILRTHEAFRNLPIVAFSAWPLETVQPMSNAYGCNGFIAKPIDTRQFVTTVESYLVKNL